MKYFRYVFVVALLFLLGACNLPVATPDPTDLPPEIVIASATPLVATVAATEASELPFEAQTYRDEANGFAIEVPASWNFLGGESQSRGGYVQFASWQLENGVFDFIPEGQSLLQIAINLWEPQYDLDARFAMRRQNFLGSGNLILEEEELLLAGDVRVMRLLLESTDGEQSLIFLSELGADYLELSGNGDIAILEAAMRSLRID